MNTTNDLQPQCPIPGGGDSEVLLAHGGGGSLMHELLEDVFFPAFESPHSEQQHDGVVLSMGPQRIAFTTDSFVVHPLWFPGGDIGSLAVNGTVNDVAMCGARPRFLSVGFVIEEGLSLELLSRIVKSMRTAADRAGVQLVTGDTKVVDRGKGDGVYINTSGIGTLEHDRTIEPRQIREGDAVLISGDIGRHGVAIMAKREGLSFDTTVESDCAPLGEPVMALFDRGIDVRCLRDCTRGGLGAGLIEIARAADKHIHLNEGDIPVGEEVRGACEILGLDPKYVANEGRMIVVVPEEDAAESLELLRDYSECEQACRIGTVTDGQPGQVTMESGLGVNRILDMPSGEQLPRIC